MALSKSYHFNVIYNRAKSTCAREEDERISLEFTKYLVAKLAGYGYNKAYYGDRDSVPGRNVFTELKRVVDGSEKTVVVISPGFRKNCWHKFCQQTSFKKLIDEDKMHRFIPVFLNISNVRPECPEEVNIQERIEFSSDTYSTELSNNEWIKLTKAFESNQDHHTQAQDHGDNKPRTEKDLLLAHPTDQRSKIAILTDEILSFVALNCQFKHDVVKLGHSLGLTGSTINDIIRNEQDPFVRAYCVLEEWRKHVDLSKEAESLNLLIRSVRNELGNDELADTLEKQRHFINSSYTNDSFKCVHKSPNTQTYRQTSLSGDRDVIADNEDHLSETPLERCRDQNSAISITQQLLSRVSVDGAPETDPSGSSSEISGSSRNTDSSVANNSSTHHDEEQMKDVANAEFKQMELSAETVQKTEHKDRDNTTIQEQILTECSTLNEIMERGESPSIQAPHSGHREMEDVKPKVALVANTLSSNPRPKEISMQTCKSPYQGTQDKELETNCKVDIIDSGTNNTSTSETDDKIGLEEVASVENTNSDENAQQTIVQKEIVEQKQNRTAFVDSVNERVSADLKPGKYEPRSISRDSDVFPDCENLSEQTVFEKDTDVKFTEQADAVIPSQASTLFSSTDKALNLVSSEMLQSDKDTIDSHHLIIRNGQQDDGQQYSIPDSGYQTLSRESLEQENDTKTSNESILLTPDEQPEHDKEFENEMPERLPPYGCCEETAKISSDIRPDFNSKSQAANAQVTSWYRIVSTTVNKFISSYSRQEFAFN